MIYTLLIWTVVASSRLDTNYDWRPIASFENWQGQDSLAKCQEAIKTLGIKSDRARCIRTK